MQKTAGEEEHFLLGEGLAQALPLADPECHHAGMRVKLALSVQEPSGVEPFGVGKDLGVAVHIAQVGDDEGLPIEGVSLVCGILQDHVVHCNLVTLNDSWMQCVSIGFNPESVRVPTTQIRLFILFDLSFSKT